MTVWICQRCRICCHGPLERAPKSSIAEAAIISFLTADDADRWEAALTRRLDRLTRSVDRVERDLEFSVEALALYIRAWLTATPPLPDGVQAAAQAKGRERYESFIEALGRRLAKGQRLSREVGEELATDPPEADRPLP